MSQFSNYDKKPPKFYISWLSMFEYANYISQDPPKSTKSPHFCRKRDKYMNNIMQERET